MSHAQDQCSIQNGVSQTLEIGFNHRYLLDALKAAPADKVKMCFNMATTPCVILPADGEDAFAYMVLPVRLKAGV